MISSQEVNQVLTVLLEDVIKSKKSEAISIQIILSNLGKNRFIIILLICVFLGFLLTLVPSSTNLTVITPETLLLAKIIWGILIIGLFILYVLFQFIKTVRSLKSRRQQVEINYTKVITQAVDSDWMTIKKIVIKSSFKKEVLEIVKIIIDNFIKNIEDKNNVNYRFIKVIAFIFIALNIFIFLPYDLIINILLYTDIKLWSGVLALLSAIGTGFILLGNFFLASNSQFEISKLKKCLCLLEQANILIDSIG